MKKRIYLLMMVALLVALFPATAQGWSLSRLITAQGTDFYLGWAWVDNDGENLYVKFQTKYDLGYCLEETAVHVATDLADIPQHNGNPTPGHFDYKNSHDCIKEFMYTIPLGDWGPGTELVVAAHAVIGSWRDPDFEETAWGANCGQLYDHMFPGSNWATYIAYTVK
jgi:hypothetical protein